MSLWLKINTQLPVDDTVTYSKGDLCVVFTMMLNLASNQ